MPYNDPDRLIHQPNSDTSRDAAESVAASKAAQRQRVYVYIFGQGESGATDDEVQVAVGIKGSSQRPRRVELFNTGDVVKNGDKRPTRTGRSAAVWVAAKFMPAAVAVQTALPFFSEQAEQF